VQVGNSRAVISSIELFPVKAEHLFYSRFLLLSHVSAASPHHFIGSESKFGKHGSQNQKPHSGPHACGT